MPQVSKRALSPKVWAQIFNLLTETLTRLDNKDRLNNFAEYFFTPTEKQMFSKRLAIAVLLGKHNDYRAISSSLKVSYDTIARVNFQMNSEKSGLKREVERILKIKAGKLFLLKLQSILDSLPKKGSWSEWGNRKYKRKLKIRDLESGLG